MSNMQEQAVSDAIIQKPLKLTIKGENFDIHPPTVGKMQILSKLYLRLEIDEKEFEENPHVEAIRVCVDKTDIVCELMAVATFHDQKDLLSDETIAERANFFKWNCKPEDFGTCMLAILTQVDYSNFMTSIRLTEMLRQNKPNTKGAVRVE